MRKTVATIISLLIVTLLSTLATAPVKAYISNLYWIEPFYRDYDPFYGTWVVGYKTGSTAELIVTTYNDWWGYPSINVTAVKVLFDWNINYTSTECPYNMSYGEYHNFLINFTVPSTDVASNMFLHTYIIYVEFTYDTNKYYWYTYGYNFAVYSLTQADAVDAYRELGARLSYIPTFYSSEAQMLLSKAQAEYYIGSQCYSRGDFTSAKTHFETGLSSFDQAFTIESDYAKTRDDYYLASQEAEIYYNSALANATMKQAEAAMIEAEAALIEANATKTQADAAAILAQSSLNQSYAWILFGLGFVIIGIGVLVYAIKKPTIPKTP